MNRWPGLFLCLFSAWAAFGVSARSAWAQASTYSTLEQSVLRQKLGERGLEIDPAPEGKRIEAVDIVRMDVFDERDPMPDFVNLFHATTRERVIRSELLFAPGEPYRQVLAAETARNLRELVQLSIVLVVPARGTVPDRVRVVVITKDVWSLRLNWLLQSQNAHINYLVLNPSEENLLGTHATIGGLFVLDPATYSLGLSLSHRRLFGSHEQAVLGANFIRNRDSGDPEGSFGEFRYGQPLYSLDTEWSWGTSVLWRHDIARVFRGVSVRTFNVDVGGGKVDAIPEQYNRDRLYGGYQVVRSFGRRFKYDVSLGIEAVRSAYSATDLSPFDPRAAALFVRAELPTSDQRISPFVQLHAHRTDFSSLIEVETLGLQEDFRRGHDLILRVFPASSSLGSSRSLIGSVAQFSYTFPVGDGLLRPVLGSRLEYASGNRDEALFDGELRFVSPRLGFGRVVLDAEVLDHARNYGNSKVLLGGDNRLRGYEAGVAQGANLAVANAELRTSSIDILSAQVGAAAFYDVGDAADELRKLQLKQGAGVGLRILFPEFDRIVFRADWGIPLSPGYRTFPGAFFVSFAQAFSMPQVVAPSVLTETL
ncbi:MAG: BamA/TamA family outer membrane protein [Polyangiaceae bacterium]